MSAAEVGDEQSLSDPTTRALERRVAALLGHQEGLFLPSGTMCNEIAIKISTTGFGDEVLAESTSHIINAEAGGPATLSGVVLRDIHGDRGVFTPDDLTAAIRRPSRYAPRSKLVCVEQTANAGGGRVWQANQIQDIVEVARRYDLSTHLDGARLLNAAIATGDDPSSHAAHFDTAWLDFSKGLGAPVGAVLVGSSELIEHAWRYKQMWGGAMRQSGYLAAAGLYALDHNVDRLARDHDNAKLLARGLAELDGIRLDPNHVETNIVYFEVDQAGWFTSELERHGILMGAKGSERVRAVTHLDVSTDEMDRAVHAAASVLKVGR